MTYNDFIPMNDLCIPITITIIIFVIIVVLFFNFNTFLIIMNMYYLKLKYTLKFVYGITYNEKNFQSVSQSVNSLHKKIQDLAGLFSMTTLYCTYLVKFVNIPQ